MGRPPRTLLLAALIVAVASVAMALDDDGLYRIVYVSDHCSFSAAVKDEPAVIAEATRIRTVFLERMCPLLPPDTMEGIEYHDSGSITVEVTSDVATFIYNNRLIAYFVIREFIYMWRDLTGNEHVHASFSFYQPASARTGKAKDVIFAVAATTPEGEVQVVMSSRG